MKGEFIEHDYDYDAAIDLYLHVNGPPAAPERVQQLDAQALQLTQDKTTVTARSCGYDVRDLKSPEAVWKLVATTKEAVTKDAVESFVSISLQHSNSFTPLLHAAFDTTNQATSLQFGIGNSNKERMKLHVTLQDMQSDDQLDSNDKAFLRSLQEYVASLGSDKSKPVVLPPVHPADRARTLVATYATHGIREQQFFHTLDDGRYVSVRQSHQLHYLDDAPEPFVDPACITISLPHDNGDILYYTRRGEIVEVTQYDNSSIHTALMDDERQELVMQQGRNALTPAFPRAEQIDVILAALQEASTTSRTAL